MQMQIIKSRLQCLMRLDSHAAANGSYHVRSLYFDDVYRTAFFANENGTEPREKFRIRIYDHDASNIFLEKKQKIRGMTQKASCVLTRTQADQLIAGQLPVCGADAAPLLQEFLSHSKSQPLHPAVIVSYDRIPYLYPAGNVRVTFDMNVASSNQISQFLEPTLAKRPIMEAGQLIMEVKWDHFLPDIIKQSLQTNSLPRTALSKYYYCRKFNLSSGVIV